MPLEDLLKEFSAAQPKQQTSPKTDKRDGLQSLLIEFTPDLKQTPKPIQQEIRRPNSMDSFRRVGQFVSEFSRGIEEGAIPFGLGKRTPSANRDLLPNEVIDLDPTNDADALQISTLSETTKALRNTRRTARTVGEMTRIGAMQAMLGGGTAPAQLFARAGKFRHLLNDASLGALAGLTNDVPEQDVPHALLGMALRAGEGAAGFAAFGAAARRMAPAAKDALRAALRERELELIRLGLRELAKQNEEAARLEIEFNKFAPPEAKAEKFYGKLNVPPQAKTELERFGGGLTPEDVRPK